MQKLVAECQINKKVSPHNLRHSFATRLVECGLNLRAIQNLLGHMRPETTAIYTRLTETRTLNTHKVINTLIDELNLSKGET